jgi:hypothetical protein
MRTSRIAGFFNFVQKLENTTFRELDLFPSSGEEGKTSIKLGPLEKS